MNVERLDFGQNGNARVPFFFADAPVLVRVERVQPRVRRPCIHLGLTQDEHVGVLGLEVAHEALGIGRLERRNVPNQHTHVACGRARKGERAAGQFLVAWKRVGRDMVVPRRSCR